MTVEDIVDHQFPFFKEPGLKEAICRKGKLVVVEAGTPILKEGSYVKTIPLLVSGLVKVIRQEGLKEFLLYYIYPLQSCIMSINCGLHELKSSFKAIAEEDSTAILLPTSMILDLQRAYPSFNAFVLSLYQKRFDDILDAYNALAFQSLDERLLSFLHAKVRATGQKKISTTHQSLGDELGTARETVSRMLKKLEVEGKVKLYRGHIELQ